MKKQGAKVSLEELKKQYSPFQKKYKLPDFSKLNEDFDIEKAQEKETEFLLREIRREITDKVAAFLRFFELFLNPQAAPLFVLGMLKNLNLHEKEIIGKIYKELVALEIEAVNLDIKYNEIDEARFIKGSFKKWQGMKPELERIGNSLRKIQTKEPKGKRSYFG
jgi:hypothetical protein